LFCTIILSVLPARAENIFNTLVTGNRTDYSGTVGFSFTADANFTIVDLGRAVNPSAALVDSHLVQLWDNTTDTALGQVTVGPTTPLDALGYADAPLSTPIHIVSGQSYSLTTQEVDNGPDMWGNQASLTGKYDASLITINNAVYSSGASGFPDNTQQPGEGYGVPTFITAVTPEPSSCVLAALGAIGLIVAARRRRS
jgi:hypothetical protein